MRTLIRRNAPMLMVWDPLAEFERLANEFWRAWEFPATYVKPPYAEVTEEDGSLVVKAELPGVSPEEIDIALKDGVLTIKAEHSEGEKAEGGAYHSRRYYRSMTLPEHIDHEKVSATMEHGLLEVRLPKTEALETKHVEVKSLKEPKSKTTGAGRARKAKKEVESKE